MTTRSQAYADGGYGEGGYGGWGDYDTQAIAVSKTPTTLIRITLDTVGTEQTAGVYLFSEQGKPLHLENPTTALPYLADEIHLAQEIQDELTLLDRVTLVFHDDFDENGASFWRKWKAANPYFYNRTVEVLKGFAGLDEEEYFIKFSGVLQNMTFSQDGKVSILCKGILALTDKQIPAPTKGELSIELAAGAVTDLTMTAETDLTQYSTAGYVKIDDEIVQYTGKIASSDLLASDDTEESTTSSTYVKLKEVATTMTGTLRIMFDLKGNSVGSSYARIYRNGSAVGLERRVGNATYTAYSQDIAGWTASDLVQLYVRQTGGDTAYVQNFRVYPATQSLTGLTRGKFSDDGWSLGSVAHAAGADVVQVKVYDNVHPVDVITDLLDQAGITSAYRHRGSFDDVKNTWLAGQLVRTVLDSPTSIKTLIKELKEQFLLSMWQGDDQLIHLNFLAPAPPATLYVEITDEDNIIFKSPSLDAGQDKRITSFEVYYNLQGASNRSDNNSYGKRAVHIDAISETNYREHKNKPIQSRWYRSDLAAETLIGWIAENYIRVTREGKSVVEFELETKDDYLQVGDIFKLTTAYLQDSSGNTLTGVKFYITKKEQSGENKWRYKAFDTRLKDRYVFFAPEGTPDYADATAAQKEYWFFCDENGLMPNGDPGYLFI